MRRLLLPALVLLLASCHRRHGGCEELTVLAAASLESILGEALRGEPGVRVSYGGSGALLRQIEAGAPAGLFLSAGSREAEELVRGGLAAGDAVTLGESTLVLVVPHGELRPGSLSMLADPRFARIALGDPATVPAGRYGRQVLERSGILPQVENRLVLAHDVTQALAWVRAGEANAGFVYESDARAAAGAVDAVEIPHELYDPVLYVAVPLKGPCAEDAKKLVEKLRSGPLAARLRAAGLHPPELR